MQMPSLSSLGTILPWGQKVLGFGMASMGQDLTLKGALRTVAVVVQEAWLRGFCFVQPSP